MIEIHTRSPSSPPPAVRLPLCEGDVLRRRCSPVTGELTRLQLYGDPRRPHVAVWVRHETGNPSIWMGYRYEDGQVRAIRSQDELEVVCASDDVQVLMPVWGDDRMERILREGGAHV